MSNNYFPISKHELMQIHKLVYRPIIPHKYFCENGVNYINTAEPTSYMMENGEPENEPKVILDLIFNICNSNIEYMNYFLNWIAYPYVTGIKPTVAVGIFGLEGVGKNIFFNIMEKLYGEENCSQINPASFKSTYNLAPDLQNKRFVNIDELTYSISDKQETLIKGIIGNPYMTLGKRIDINCQFLFTTNYLTVFKINEGNRRFTIFESGLKLESTNFLGLGDYNSLWNQIVNELDDFSKYLKSLKINKHQANNPMPTPEKQSIINLSKSFMSNFHKAIVNLDMSFFKILKVRNNSFYHDLSYECVIKKRFNKAHLEEAYFLMTGDRISTVSLMNQFREIDKNGIFESKNSELYQGHSDKEHFIYPKGRGI